LRLAEFKIRLLGFFVAGLRRWAGTIEQEIVNAKAPPNPVREAGVDDVSETSSGPPEHWARLFPTAPPQHWLDLFAESTDVQPAEVRPNANADLSARPGPEAADLEAGQEEPEARRDPEQRRSRQRTRGTVFQNRYQEPASHSATTAGKTWLDRLRFSPPAPRSVTHEGLDTAAGERYGSGSDDAIAETMSSGANRYVRPTLDRPRAKNSSFPDRAIGESAKRGANQFHPALTLASALNAGDKVSGDDRAPDYPNVERPTSVSNNRDEQRERPGIPRLGKQTGRGPRQSGSTSVLAERSEDAFRDFAETDRIAEKKREVAFKKSDQFPNVVSAARDGSTSPSFTQAGSRDPQSYIARETSAKGERVSISTSSETTANAARRRNEFQAVGPSVGALGVGEPDLGSNVDRWPTLPPPQSSGIDDELLAREAETTALRRLEREQRGILWNE
jgi:hypothetical protein